MMILFETPAGYALFKVLNAKKLSEVNDVYQFFSSPEAAAKTYPPDPIVLASSSRPSTNSLTPRRLLSPWPRC